jgi:hypothetical protein
MHVVRLLRRQLLRLVLLLLVLLLLLQLAGKLLLAQLHILL